MYGCNAGQPIAILIHTVLPYCVIIVQELMHGNKVSPYEDFFVNPFSSDVISPNHNELRPRVQVLVEAHAVEQ